MAGRFLSPPPPALPRPAPPIPPNSLCPSARAPGCGKLTSWAGNQHGAYLPLASSWVWPTGGTGMDQQEMGGVGGKNVGVFIPRLWQVLPSPPGWGGWGGAFSPGGTALTKVPVSAPSLRPCRPVHGKGFPALPGPGTLHSPPCFPSTLLTPL